MPELFPVERLEDNEITFQFKQNGAEIYRVYVKTQENIVVDSFMVPKQENGLCHITIKYKMKHPGYLTVVGCEWWHGSLVEKEVVKEYSHSYILSPDVPIVRPLIRDGSIVIRR